MISGCCEGDCHYRLGNEWMDQRFAKERMPILRTRVPRDKVRIRWLGEQGTKQLGREVKEFQALLLENVQEHEQLDVVGIVESVEVSNG